MSRTIAGVACVVGALLTTVSVVFSSTCSDSVFAAVNGLVSWDCQLDWSGWGASSPGKTREHGALMLLALCGLVAAGYGLCRLARRLSSGRMGR